MTSTAGPAPTLKLLFDTDPGVDDAMALLFLHRHPRAQLLGVTTVFGNAEVDVTTRNALYLAERFGITAPVARGAALPLVRPPRGAAPEVHGDDGLGNLPQPPATTLKVDSRPAHRLIIDTLRRHPHEVTLLAVGPLTNLALALAEDPSIAGLVNRVVVMGGAFGTHGHAGNVSPVAEANVFSDPQAADAVFTADWPVTVVGLDVTHQVVMGPSAFDELRDHGGDAGAFIWACSRHYVDFYGRAVGVQGCYVHDASAVACALAPELFGTRRGPVRVVPHGLAQGQTIQSAAGRRWSGSRDWDGVPDQAVCTAVDGQAVLDLYLRTMCPPRST